jgi:dihydrofolate reductase
MRKIILGLALSLDGFIEGPNGEYDWCFTDQDYGFSAFLKRIDTYFMGRKSYEALIAMGENNTGSLPKLKEYIFSTTLQNVREGATIISGDILNEVLKIKQEEGKDIWLFGGAGLCTSLMNLGLVDELYLAVHPILLGKGKPLFNDIQNRVQLNLLESKTYSTGLVTLTYSLNEIKAD